MDPDQADRVRLVRLFHRGRDGGIGAGFHWREPDAVALEAMDALGPKAKTWVPQPNFPLPRPSRQRVTRATAAVSEVVTLVNHAACILGRPCSFVQTAAGYQADITARNVTTGAGPPT